MKPADFVAKWSAVQPKESAAAQSHFNDIFDLIGHRKPLNPGSDVAGR